MSSPTKFQWRAVIRIDDYWLKHFDCFEKNPSFENKVYPDNQSWQVFPIL